MILNTIFKSSAFRTVQCAQSLNQSINGTEGTGYVKQMKASVKWVKRSVEKAYKMWGYVKLTNVAVLYVVMQLIDVIIGYGHMKESEESSEREKSSIGRGGEK